WKSGWPMPRLITSLPDCASAVARASTAKAFSSPMRSKAGTVWSMFGFRLVLCRAYGFCERHRALSIWGHALKIDLPVWTPRERPRRQSLEGRFVRLEPLDAARHGAGVFEASTTEDADARVRWLRGYAAESRGRVPYWLATDAASAGPL